MKTIKQLLKKNKNICFISLFLFVIVTGQDYRLAPNSYVYPIISLQNGGYESFGKEGLYIPVKKAYAMWQDASGYLNSPIPQGTLSASVYWEDVSGLIKSVSMENGTTVDLSKIKVLIDHNKGKGNALIAFHVGPNGNNSDPIYWTWHIWVTDNPSIEGQYGHTISSGYLEKDKLGNTFQPQYMDRNLGATNNSFLGNDWNKSGGLMYQWGRKDPFPPLVYKDGTFYEIYNYTNGVTKNIRHADSRVKSGYEITMQKRPYDLIYDNIKYSVMNPLTFIYNTISLNNSDGTWFSKKRKYDDTNSINYDLWGDNNLGKLGGDWSLEMSTYERKSPFDPCPNEWRVPSFMAQQSTGNAFSPWGRNGGINDDANYSLIQPNTTNNVYQNIKIYPSLGADFTGVVDTNGAKNLGKFPLTGNYEYYENSSDISKSRSIYQDNWSESNIWSATLAGGIDVRTFTLISDMGRKDIDPKYGLHKVLVTTGMNPAREGFAVRCMKDPNVNLNLSSTLTSYNFPTEYITASKAIDLAGLNNPNSYIINGQTEIQIPLNKAFAIRKKYYNQDIILTSIGRRITSTMVTWSDNQNIVTQAEIIGTDKNAYILVKINPNEKGNAIVSFVYKKTNDIPPIKTTIETIWSWHIWSPDSDPTTNFLKYTTEGTLSSTNLVNPTKSGFPPIETTFMDRNLGAISSFPIDLKNNPNDQLLIEKAKKSIGLHYQWGRKDPIPVFVDNSSIIYSNIDKDQTLAKQLIIDSETFNNNYTRNNYIANSLYFAIPVPLFYLYKQGQGAPYDFNKDNNDLSKVKDWLSKNGLATDRWGHGTSKSPFDPCPEGWRVPDTSFANLYLSQKGSSPWFNGKVNDSYGNIGVLQSKNHDISTYYKGTKISELGWIFDDPSYNIGNFPNNGIRGELGDYSLSFNSSGLWTAAMADAFTGYAISMDFTGNNMRTGVGAYPQAAMAVRCAKDEPRYTGIPIPSTVQRMSNIIKSEKKNEISNNRIDKIMISPNPVKDIMKINIQEKISFKIYDISGRLIKEGSFVGGNSNIEEINNGIYFVLFENGEIIKIIKN